MTIVRGLDATGLPSLPVVRPRDGAAGTKFAVDLEPASGEAAVASRAASTAELSGLIFLQVEGEEPVENRAARRRARDLLAALRRLQGALLGDVGDPDAVNTLVALVEDLPTPADGELAAALQGLALRARIEVERRQSTRFPNKKGTVET